MDFWLREAKNKVSKKVEEKIKILKNGKSREKREPTAEQKKGNKKIIIGYLFQV